MAVSAPIGYLLLFLPISLIKPRNKAVKCLNVKRNIFRAKKPLISWTGGREKELGRERSRKVKKGRGRLRKVEEGRERSRKVEKGRGRSRKVEEGRGRSRKVEEGRERSRKVEKGRSIEVFEVK
jgi:hypothetical protein